MKAFAVDSANNSIGGAGPLTQRPDHAQFMGQDHEAASMYGMPARRTGGSKSEAVFFDPKQGNEFVEGEESLGLGSSTFLEGTPAARTVIEKTQAETQAMEQQNLGRKKSVVQRFRSIKRGPRDYDAGRVTSPESSYATPKTGGMSAGNNANERNPFFAEFDETEEHISVKRKDSNPRSPSSPPLPNSNLERRATDDGAAGDGFLSRVRSLKGGRRRPDVPGREAPPAPGVAM